MKTRLLTIALFICLIGTANAFDLGTLFGSPKPTPIAITKAMACKSTKYTLIANGSDSAVISAQDLSGTAITTVDATVTGASGARSFSNVTLPKTVTSTVAGQWDFTITKNGYNSNCAFSIVAQ
jgi:hypothetical protein